MKRLDDSFTVFLLKHLKDFIHLYALGICCLFVTHLCQSQLPFLAKQLGDVLLEQDGESISLWTFFGIAVAIVVFRTSSRLLFFYPARIQQKNIRVEFVEKLERSNPERYKSYSSGQIYQIMFNDLSMIRALVGFGLLQMGNMIVALGVLIPRLIDFNPSFLIAFSPLLVSVIVFSIIASVYQPYIERAFDYQGDTQNYLIESYKGKKTIKTYQAENPFIKHFGHYSYTELREFYKASKGPAIGVPMVRLGFAASLLWGAYMVKEQGLSASSLILFSGFAYLLLEPFMFLSWIGVVITRSYSAWKRIKKLLNLIDQESQMERGIAGRKIEDLGEGRSCYGVEYWGDDIYLDIKDGSWTGIIGGTGSGKTHALKGIANLLKMNGKTASFVAQEPYLYNDTIAANLFLGKEVNDQDYQSGYELLKLFELDVLEEDKDRLFALEVGENGKQLSGGQIKRLSLARSILSGDQFLIWDDPFSSIDFILEKKIINKIKASSMMKGITIILSTHRITTMRFTDQTVYLKKKMGIIESGNSTDLLNGMSKTSEYFRKQMV